MRLPRLALAGPVDPQGAEIRARVTVPAVNARGLGIEVLAAHPGTDLVDPCTCAWDEYDAPEDVAVIVAACPVHGRRAA